MDESASRETHGRGGRHASFDGRVLDAAGADPEDQTTQVGPAAGNALSETIDRIAISVSRFRGSGNSARRVCLQ
jgi:hypothetical protein